MIYKINDVFYSIQGEGFNTGMPAIFIRFAGCNLKCDFCDTDFNHKGDADIDRIHEFLKKFNCKNIVLTGGEPTLQNIEPLIESLQDTYYIAIETNGYDFSKTIKADWVTFSPKENWKEICKERSVQWDELKVVYTGQDLNQYKDLLCDYNYLQPCEEKFKSESGDGLAMNIDDTIKKIKEDPKWRLSLQTHKLINIA
jgi:organic radical activating enzyme